MNRMGDYCNEKNRENMKSYGCDNGRVYLAFKNSCVFCEHHNLFWDYTNDPYLILCDADKNTKTGMSGKCDFFEELEGTDNG